MYYLLAKQENQNKSEKKVYAYEIETKDMYIIDMKRAQLKGSESLVPGLIYMSMMVSGIFIFLYFGKISSWFMFVSLVIWTCANVILLNAITQKTIKKAKKNGLIEYYPQYRFTEEAILPNIDFFGKLAQNMKVGKRMKYLSILLSLVIIISVIYLIQIKHEENRFFIYCLSFICSWTLYPSCIGFVRWKKTKEAQTYVKNLVKRYEEIK